MDGCCCNHDHEHGKKFDYLFWTTFGISILGFVLYAVHPPILDSMPKLGEFTANIHEFLHKMWWGILLGIIFIGIVGQIPREVVINLLGREKNISSILRAVAAGILLDLCSHGILLVAMRLYERGVRLSQVFAFLIASPWNSFSLTIILITLIGWKWTLLYIALSVVVAVISGLVIEYLVTKGVLKDNPHTIDIPPDFSFKESLKNEFGGKKLSDILNPRIFADAFRESEVILRWVFLGVIAAALIRAFIPTDVFMAFFGPSLIGLVLTLVAATIIEVCSEGSVPIAYDLFARAAAPGNAFLFLMAGASTDYTEIMALKETTRSWKIALFLPLVTVPQILALGYILNHL